MLLEQLSAVSQVLQTDARKLEQMLGLILWAECMGRMWTVQGATGVDSFLPAAVSSLTRHFVQHCTATIQVVVAKSDIPLHLGGPGVLEPQPATIVGTPFTLVREHL